MTLFSAGPWPDPVLIDVDETPLAVVRHEGVTVADLTEVFDASYDAVTSAVPAAGAEFVDAALAVYEGDMSSAFTVEAGFPLAQALPETVAAGGLIVAPSALLSGRYAVLTHMGSYAELPNSWDRLIAWVQEQNLTPGVRYGEIYVTMPYPEIDPSTLRSDLFLTVG